MDNQRRNGEAEVEDEFACAGMLRGSLTSLHDAVERIFQVTFGIGADDLPQGNNGQIWLKLCGTSKNVEAAKLFVKGIVNQEAQQQVSYPKVLHCIFCGAKGLFMDCLIKTTSAHVMVASPGNLLISGLAEPVVQAYSLITELVERYEGTRHSETGDRVPSESIESRRAFKTLVEKREDRHILDLLVLPGWVKEILLDFVKESGLDSISDLEVREGNAGSHDQTSAMNTNFRPFITADWEEEGTAAVSRNKSSSKTSSSSTIKKQKHSPAQRHTVRTEMREAEEEQRLSAGNKEFCLLLKFFTAMGYTESVVNRVLARTGPKEASQILDLVQQEQDRSDQEQVLHGFSDMRGENINTLNEKARNRPCETEHKEDPDAAAASAERDLIMISNNGKVRENMEGGLSGEPEGGSQEKKENGNEEDFVLGVVKKAAASCGYSEQKVAKVYGMLNNGSTHKLLLELQREETQEANSLREGPRETDDVVLEKKKAGSGQDNVDTDSDDDGWVEFPASVPGPVLFPRMTTPQQLPVSQFVSQPKQHQLSESRTPHRNIHSDIKGLPMTLYPSLSDAPPAPNIPTKAHFEHTIHVPNLTMLKQKHYSQDNVGNHLPSNSQKKVLPNPDMIRNNLSPTRMTHQHGSTPASTVVVTGEQRFLEGLQTPFDLELTDKPGVQKLRAIIIDGSNVAMSHGLGHFFSCRGIALAVQHFWDRGHREIQVLVPQWRQKSDPRIKEKHFMSKLYDLGLLSYTPSREVQGRRISCYDDRFMLQHAEKTNGVIVTNDNLRDLIDESEKWTDIIKKSLLQYTFVGDHFMVPDDPLGRGGPHLEDFLRSEPRISEPARNTLTGVATTSSSSKPLHSQAEVPNHWTRFGTQVNKGGKDKGGRGGHGKGWQSGNRQLHKAGPQRNPEQTSRLREQLCQIFPGQDNEVALVLQCHPTETDICMLTDEILELQKN